MDDVVDSVVDFKKGNHQSQIAIFFHCYGDTKRPFVITNNEK